MTNFSSKKLKRIVPDDYRAEPARRGWNDAINGKEFDYKYVDSLNEGAATAYENWRLRAMDCMRSFRLLPDWPENFGIPYDIETAYRTVCYAARAVGQPVAHLNTIRK
jgi:hypothetical protein